MAFRYVSLIFSGYIRRIKILFVCFGVGALHFLFAINLHQ